MNRKIRILFIRPSKSSFIQKDLEILRKHFDVKIVDSDLTGKSLKGALVTIYNMIKEILRVDITFSWFAGTHAFVAILLSKIFRKRSIVVVGGYEVAEVPEMGYGAMLRARSARKVKFVLKHADKILVVDPSLKEDAIKNAKVSGENIDCLSTGYDSNYWKRKDEKEDIVLTVGSVDKLVVKRKGFEVFVKAARHIPSAKFVLVGKHIDNSVEYLKSIAPPNVEFTGFVSDEDLLKWYQKVKVYCQLSRYEGLPNALCEAMLCECVPVGTNYCGIPTAIGDTGFYVPYGDPKATAGAIREALNSDKGREARERINEMFSMQRRERELMRIIKEV